MLTKAMRLKRPHRTQSKKHIPCINVCIATFVIISAPIVHDLHFPARRELPSYDFRAPVPMEPLKVLYTEEQPRADTLDDDTRTTTLELPLCDAGEGEL